MGAPDRIMESITGHLSRRMLERYSHIRMDARPAVLDALDAHRIEAANGQDSIGSIEATSQTAAQSAIEQAGPSH